MSTNYKFGCYSISYREVFYTTLLSFAFVNIRPVLPGVHVLVCPIRQVKRFADLTEQETTDLWLTAQQIGRQLQSYHNASSLTFTIQDGPESGQSVPHVHVHILPRKASDFDNAMIDDGNGETKEKLDLDKKRKDRSLEERAQEADQYRSLFFFSDVAATTT